MKLIAVTWYDTKLFGDSNEVKIKTFIFNIFIRKNTPDS